MKQVANDMCLTLLESPWPLVLKRCQTRLGIRKHNDWVRLSIPTTADLIKCNGLEVFLMESCQLAWISKILQKLNEVAQSNALGKSDILQSLRIHTTKALCNVARGCIP